MATPKSIKMIPLVGENWLLVNQGTEKPETKRNGFIGHCPKRFVTFSSAKVSRKVDGSPPDPPLNMVIYHTKKEDHFVIPRM